MRAGMNTPEKQTMTNSTPKRRGKLPIWWATMSISAPIARARSVPIISFRRSNRSASGPAIGVIKKMGRRLKEHAWREEEKTSRAKKRVEAKAAAGRGRG